VDTKQAFSFSKPGEEVWREMKEFIVALFYTFLKTLKINFLGIESIKYLIWHMISI
jgi:hypothetical protein